MSLDTLVGLALVAIVVAFVGGAVAMRGQPRPGDRHDTTATGGAPTTDGRPGAGSGAWDETDRDGRPGDVGFEGGEGAVSRGGGGTVTVPAVAVGEGIAAATARPEPVVEGTRGRKRHARR